MKHFFLSILLLLTTRLASAQANPGESFFDKYLPIAQLFDSPIFFGCVVGSAVFLLFLCLVFLLYAKRQEKKADEWGQGKSIALLIEALSSPIPQESRLAYICLRRRSGANELPALTGALEDQRRKGNVNPTLIYLLEDLQAQSALPILQQIAKGKTKAATLAQRAVDRLLSLQEDEKPEPAKQAAK